MAITGLAESPFFELGLKINHSVRMCAKTRWIDFIFVLLAAGGMALLAGNARGADDAMPPEVKALIGMKIPAKAGNVVPGWKIMGSGMLGVKADTGQELGYEQLYQKNISIFLIYAMDKDHNRTIQDVRVLPRQILRYLIKDKANSGMKCNFE